MLLDSGWAPVPPKLERVVSRGDVVAVKGSHISIIQNVPFSIVTGIDVLGFGQVLSLGQIYG
jgi:hypothetical protein